MPTYDNEEGRPAIKMRRLDGCERERGEQAIWGHGLLRCICKLFEAAKTWPLRWTLDSKNSTFPQPSGITFQENHTKME